MVDSILAKSFMGTRGRVCDIPNMSMARLHIVTLLFIFYAEYIIQNAGWRKHRLESKLLGEISTTSDKQMTPPLWQKGKN